MAAERTQSPPLPPRSAASQRQKPLKAVGVDSSNHNVRERLPDHARRLPTPKQNSTENGTSPSVTGHLRQKLSTPVPPTPAKSSVPSPAAPQKPQYPPAPCKTAIKRSASCLSEDYTPAQKRQAVVPPSKVQQSPRPCQPPQQPVLAAPTKASITPSGYSPAQICERREQAALAQAAESVHARREARKTELKQDPNRNYHSLLETLDFWPLERGQRVDPYIRSLLANQRMPVEEESDLGVAIVYAKKHWEEYRRYPKDVERTSEDARRGIEKLAPEETKEKAAKRVRTKR